MDEMLGQPMLQAFRNQIKNQKNHDTRFCNPLDSGMLQITSKNNRCIPYNVGLEIYMFHPIPAQELYVKYLNYKANVPSMLSKYATKTCNLHPEDPIGPS